MEYIGFILLALAVLAWLAVMIAGLIAALPGGLIGLAVILGVGFLLAKAVKDRLSNKEDDHYAKTVQK